MKIAVNCWILRNKNIDGIGNFTIETLRPLISAHPEIHFEILCDKNFTEAYFDFPNVSKHPIYPPYRHPLLYLWYMEIVTGSFLRKSKPDLFLSMDGFLCLHTSCTQLPVIYDLNFEHQPKDLPFRNRVYFRTFYPKFARKARRIATISEYSKTDISNTYRVSPEKIDNVSCGIKAKFSPLSPDDITKAKNKYSGGLDYFFFVGSMHPRKNIVRLLSAFDLFKQITGSLMKLVLAGNILWDDESLQEILPTLLFKKDIVFAGRVSDDELKLLLGSALALTFVPTFEGFGLPIVEAFQSNVPVISSNTTSMPEVAGDAALYVDPFSVKEIARQMEIIVSDDDLQRQLIAKGTIQKQKFSWDETSRLLYASILKCLE